jgi:site-specific DNA-cytosine methylase
MAALTGFMTSERIIRHAHVFCGIGAGAKGFNMSKARVGPVSARFVCTGGIDVDPGAIRNFERLTGCPGTVLDLFSRDQYVAFHGHEPPNGWREATPADVRAALVGPDGVRPDVIFLSAPCKGFSGLLSSKQSATDKYQALNGLTLRGVWLICEAFKDGPIPVILFENVPRILTRGRPLLDQIAAILRGYSYNVAETVHDCGELGGLAQSRKRMLLIARQREIIPNFIYEPEKKRLRGVGEVIGKLPLPGDPLAGIMHRVPMLQWKTWVRLAFVPAGRDWRALNELAVEDGFLKDFGIVPELPMRDGVLGVHGWGDTSGVIIGNQRSPLHGRHSVADPRVSAMHHDSLGVRAWRDEARVVAGASRPANGAHSVADPRPGYRASTHQNILSVAAFDGSSKPITGARHVAGGALSVADPRPTARNQTFQQYGVAEWHGKINAVSGQSTPGGWVYSVADIRVHNGHPKSVQLGVRAWGQTAACVKGDMSVGTGPYAVQDVRLEGKPRFNNTYRIVRYGDAASAIAGPGGPAGGAAVADPRPAASDYSSRKYKVTPYTAASRAVIGASTTGDGAFAVADVRCTWGNGSHQNKLRVTNYGGPAGSVIGSDRVGSGAPVVADARREHYQTCGHYGVVGWGNTSGTISASIGHDNGPGSVADPRPLISAPSFEVEAIKALPKPDERLVCRIIAPDETWHRPFTTLELAALQSIVDPEEAFYQDANGWHARLPFDLESKSDSEKREWIGNAVPSESAAEIGSVIGEAILLADVGETFALSSNAIWVSPTRVALAVEQNQAALQWEARA